MTELNDPMSTTPNDFQEFQRRNYAWRKWIYETQMWITKFQELQKDIAAKYDTAEKSENVYEKTTNIRDAQQMVKMFRLLRTKYFIHEIEVSKALDELKNTCPFCGAHNIRTYEFFQRMRNHCLECNADLDTNQWMPGAVRGGSAFDGMKIDDVIFRTLRIETAKKI